MTLKEYIVVNHGDAGVALWNREQWLTHLAEARTNSPGYDPPIITTFNADEQLKEQKGLRWVKGSDRQPPNGVDVPIKEYSGVFEIASYSEKDDMFHTYSDLGPLSKHQVYWLEETEPGQPVPAGEVLPRSIEEMIAKEPVTFFLANALKYLDENQKIALRDALIERTPKQDNQ